jgi:glycosyltransferase
MLSAVGRDPSMKISVVTVALNSGATVGNTVASFLEQTHPDKELIVIDGASSDDTLAVVRSFKSNAIRIVSERDAGPYEAMNKGLALFDGDAVGFLNSDDRFHDRDALARIAAGLEDADIAYGDLDMVRGQTDRTVVRVWRAGRYSRPRLKLGWMPPHPTFYVRRQVVEQVGQFDPSYSTSADYDFILRALAPEQFSLHYIPHVLVDYQLGGLSSRNLRATVRGNLKCLIARRAHLGAGLVDWGLIVRPLGKLTQLRRILGYYRS